MLEELNAIQQLDNLLTYKFIRDKYEDGKIKLHAYYYDIGTGLIRVYDYDSHYTDILEDIKADRQSTLTKTTGQIQAITKESS